MRKRFALLAALACATAQAQPITLPDNYWLNVGGASWHDRPGFNNTNPALAFEARWDNTRAMGAGLALNSQRRWSPFLYGKYQPWAVPTPLGAVRLGGMVGATGNYALRNGAEIPLAALAADLPGRERTWSLNVVPRVRGLTSATAVTVYLLVRL